MYYKIKPSISFHIWGPDAHEDKGVVPGLSQRINLLPMRRFHVMRNKRFQSVHLCLKAPVELKCKHKGETMLKT